MPDWIDIRKELPWLGRESIFLVDNSAEGTLSDKLRDFGFVISILDGNRISDEGTFFLEAALAFGFPDYIGANWNAFRDCFGDLAYRPEKRRAIIWRHASKSLGADLCLFLKATHELLNCATELTGFNSKDMEPVQVELFLLGIGSQFGKRPGIQESRND